jgi:putative ABC transport system permease protein
VIRWAWRLFRREWRQQLLVLALLIVAVAATILGVAVASATPGAPGKATFGTANALITLPGHGPHLSSDLAAIKNQFGTTDVIENQSLSTGLVQPVQLRAQDPAGPYGGPTIALVSGRYPNGPGQVAMTSQVASIYGAHPGEVWHQGGRTWQVTGLVENPNNLLDEFALVAPGQVTAPTQVTVLVDAGGTGTGPGPGQPGGPPGPGSQNTISASSLPQGATVSYPTPNPAQIPPATIVLVVAALGLIFIGLVAVAGYTVMAQRRLRALGMLSALGATEPNVRLVMVANGAIVGLVGTLIGAALGLGAWFAYAPSLQTATAHRVDPLGLPWWAVITGMALAVATSIVAARRPARSAARLPVIAALSGRPAPPKAVHRSAVPGIALLAAGAVLLTFSGGWSGNSGPQSLFLLLGLVGLILGLLTIAPLGVAVLAVAGRRAPVAVRLALRDLSRYRARSGAALAAISFAIFLAVMISIVASVRFSNSLDYTGPNLTSSQLIVYTQNGGQGISSGQPPASSQLAALQSQVNALAGSLHAQSVVALESAVNPKGTGGPGGSQLSTTLQQQGTRNNNYSGPLYVATPALLAQYGITAGQVSPATDVLTMRPGLATEPHMQIVSCFAGPFNSSTCPAGSTVDNPKIQTAGRLPAGTSAPNTVITMHAVRALGLQLIPDGWLIQTKQPLTAPQINAGRQVALGAGTTAESKSGELGLTQISNGATAIGILIALGVLAMTIGLIRSETSRDLRTLTATGASGRTRRTITAATAGALGLLGGILGTAVAAVAGLAWARSSLSTTFGNIPALDLLVILVGLPVVAAVGGWLLAGREPAVIARQPLELDQIRLS